MFLSQITHFPSHLPVHMAYDALEQVSIECATVGEVLNVSIGFSSSVNDINKKKIYNITHQPFHKGHKADPDALPFGVMQRVPL